MIKQQGLFPYQLYISILQNNEHNIYNKDDFFISKWDNLISYYK